MAHRRPKPLPAPAPALSGPGRRVVVAAAVLAAVLLAAPGGSSRAAGPTPSFSVATLADGSESLTAAPAAATASYRWTFGDGGSADGRTVRHRFAGAGIYDVTLEVTDGGAAGSVTESVTADPASVYAPLVYLAPGETLFPGDVGDFIAHSALYWQNGTVRSGGVSTACPPTLVAAEGRIDPARLGGTPPAVPYREHAIPATVPAGTTPCRPTGTVYSTRIFTTPQNGRAAPQGFYLDLLPPGPGADPAAHAGDRSLAHGAYFDYVPGRYVDFWLFYPYNDDRTLRVVQEIHEGDWEHVVVRLDRTDTATAVAYAQHSCVQSIVSWAALAHPEGTLAARGGGLYASTHPVVYAARGGHASYSTTGTHYFTCPGRPEEGFGDVTGRGAAWRTWLGEQGLKGQPWRGYRGAWGFGTGTRLHPWGPLGPFAGRVGIVPAGW